MNAFSKYLLIAFGIVLVGLVLWYFSSIVAYILVAAVLSLMGRPVVGMLGKIRIGRFRISDGLNALLTLILIWLLVFGFLRLFVPLVANEANDLSQIDSEMLVERLKEPIQSLERMYNDFNTGNEGYISFEDYINEKISSVLNISFITNFFSSIFSILGNMFVAVFAISFITFFLLKDKSVITDFVVLLVPQKHEEAIRNAMTDIRNLLVRYFIGIGGQITAIMIMVTIALVIGLLNVIPYLGPFLGGTIGILLGIANNLQMDLSAELLPLIGSMLLVVLIAGTLAGIPGMILGIPTYKVIRVFAKEFLSQVRVVKKLTKNI